MIEPFEGNIASEMTLGEAIVRGILNAPKYVLSVYGYQMDLKRYQARVKRVKNYIIRDEAEKHLEALRCALDRTDGPDEIFRKHMTEPHGRYIVFCSDKEHMDEVMAQSGVWFKGVDPEPHYYIMYAENAGADRTLRDFMADDTDHLRLLICEDAPERSVCVDGAVLLRATVSPAIFKEQMRYVLSEVKSTGTVVFDMVTNLENLYSIGVIENEMQEAAAYLRSHGKDEEIINECLEVIDETQDCRELFRLLDESMTGSWDGMYGHAKKYYEQHGDLLVPRRYKTENDDPLGQWILKQRQIRSGEVYGYLGDERIAKLDAIDMIWDKRGEFLWEQNIAAARKYYETYGNLNVPVQYITENGLPLGKWLENLRVWRKHGTKTKILTTERIQMLDGLGMIWEVTDFAWQQNYSACETYYRRHGDLDVSILYVSENGLHIGAWLEKLRRRRREHPEYLTGKQIRQLDEIGMKWDGVREINWRVGYHEALNHQRRHGHLDVSEGYRTETGYPLGHWLRIQRESGTLSVEQKNLLSQIGVKHTACANVELERQHRNAKPPCGQNKIKVISSDGVGTNL